MAARRGKSQAKRTNGNGTPGWVWLIAGLVLGAAAFFIVPDLMKKDGDTFLRPKPNPDARPAPVSEDDSATPPASAPAETGAAPAATAETAKKPPERPTQYDFYTLLPGREVQMSDAELAASARAEADRKAKLAAQQAREDAAKNAGQPQPIAETTTAAAQQPTPLDEITKVPSATPTQTTVAQAAASNAVASAAGDVAYILQAGSFSASGDAEAVKAKIAMLGLSARVESGDSAGKTVYRVRMGPYATASELAEAKQKLASGGLPAMPIKAR
ncbi:SPOR domain-containing protein [Pseudoxanthomonas winnipegensis]|mgnify:CR=1 FL=1|uniref:Sporulation protein n=1 Tax=Pseudoxanthomonas winnipegensis TaxID=2480810 RepID=A0A4Q8LKI6_9GAMM|nr:SPOR domain-containing protein [Pseudoxanthomonas winnipegensis]RZZ81447.1 sporulation protein [Pseudoxanthomonas winnipegensis]TAA30264.1 sporulation protein [Pseudoxanthomonas winnipegensis]TAA38909.1 sporulation protein [Pseudoxanthomonas winnipegensis]WJI15307.1 SPOR domain-containing protein [Pseudoxanthomonas winnipegensis]